MSPKSIEFVCRNYAFTVSVDLDLLSPKARRVAEGIATTRNDDDLSNVRIRARETQAEINRRQALAGQWPPFVPKPRDPAEQAAAYDAWEAKWRQMYGEMCDEYPSILWRWPEIKGKVSNPRTPSGRWIPGETTEEYLERNVRQMMAVGVITRVGIDPMMEE